MKPWSRKTGPVLLTPSVTTSSYFFKHPQAEDFTPRFFTESKEQSSKRMADRVHRPVILGDEGGFPLCCACHGGEEDLWPRSCSVARLCLTLCDPRTAAQQAPLSFTISPEFAQIHVHDLQVNNLTPPMGSQVKWWPWWRDRIYSQETEGFARPNQWFEKQWNQFSLDISLALEEPS